MAGLLQRLVDRAAWEWRELRRPSRPSFTREELDDALLARIAWPPGERVLDVGCAGGTYLAALKQRGTRPIGLDIQEDALKHCAADGHTVLAASGQAIPLASGSVEAVLCHKTLYLFDDPALAAQELVRVLRPGGRVVFSGSNVASPYARAQAAVLARNGRSNWAVGNRWGISDWIRRFRRLGLRTRAIYSCNLTWPLVFRVCDTWILPNEWMRRYARWIRRLTRAPLRTHRPLGAAQDYVVEMVRTETP